MICPTVHVMIQELTHCVLFTLAAAFVQPTFAEHPAISGTWELDVAASSFGSTSQPDSGVLAISTGPHKTLHVMVSMEGSHQEHTVESDWRVDDRYHPVAGGTGGELLAKWEGPILTGKRQTETGIEETRFRLGPGGESLTESIVSGTNVTTLIWRRR